MIPPEQVARKLLTGARELLVEHVEGCRFVEVPVVADDRKRTRQALLKLNLIKYGHYLDDQGTECETYSVRQKKTFITEAGREVLAVILAQCAESLMRAGYEVIMESETAIATAARRVAEIQSRKAAVLHAQSTALQLSSGQFGTSPSPSKASGPAATV